MIGLYNDDCLKIMAAIPSASIDAVICDPPYGTTPCKWDSVIPFEPMWEQLKRIIKPNGAIVLFSSQPFTSALVMSNPEMYKYEWVWEKPNGTNFISTKYQPFRVHENILVFGFGAITFTKSGNTLAYNPQKTAGKPYTATTGEAERSGVHRPGSDMAGYTTVNTGDRMPRTVQKFNPEKGLHPTQKPVALMEYLIKTYTNEGEIVLDFTMGSGTTGVAAVNLNRHFVGIELDKGYFDIAQTRIKAAEALHE
jgi:site-specific DNA-methyltransferase (adenine-specific)